MRSDQSDLRGAGTGVAAKLVFNAPVSPLSPGLGAGQAPRRSSSATSGEHGQAVLPPPQEGQPAALVSLRPERTTQPLTEEHGRALKCVSRCGILLESEFIMDALTETQEYDDVVLDLSDLPLAELLSSDADDVFTASLVKRYTVDMDDLRISAFNSAP
jgi:hypothetical protein